jgi:hypothetical protein
MISNMTPNRFCSCRRLLELPVAAETVHYRTWAASHCSKRSIPHATLLKRTQTPAASPMVDDAFWEGHGSCSVTFAPTSQMTCQGQVDSVSSKWQQFVQDSATGIDWYQDFRIGV